jgi:hypothetical protein
MLVCGGQRRRNKPEPHKISRCTVGKSWFPGPRAEHTTVTPVLGHKPRAGRTWAYGRGNGTGSSARTVKACPAAQHSARTVIRKPLAIFKNDATGAFRSSPAAPPSRTSAEDGQDRRACLDRPCESRPRLRLARRSRPRRRARRPSAAGRRPRWRRARSGRRSRRAPRAHAAAPLPTLSKSRSACTARLCTRGSRPRRRTRPAAPGCVVSPPADARPHDPLQIPHGVRNSHKLYAPQKFNFGKCGANLEVGRFAALYSLAFNP